MGDDLPILMTAGPVRECTHMHNGVVMAPSGFTLEFDAVDKTNRQVIVSRFEKAQGDDLLAMLLRRAGLGVGTWMARLNRPFKCSGATKRVSVQSFSTWSVTIRLKPGDNESSMELYLVVTKDRDLSCNIFAQLRAACEDEQWQHDIDKWCETGALPSPKMPPAPKVRVSPPSPSPSPQPKEEEPVESTRTKISHPEFYKLCNEVASQAEKLMEEKPTKEAAAEAISKKLGFHVPLNSLANACAAVGVKWLAKRKLRKKSESLVAIRKALILLFEKLGEPVPDDLK
jgi:hypothetical protein